DSPGKPDQDRSQHPPRPRERTTQTKLDLFSPRTLVRNLEVHIKRVRGDRVPEPFTVHPLPHRSPQRGHQLTLGRRRVHNHVLARYQRRELDPTVSVLTRIKRVVGQSPSPGRLHNPDRPHRLIGRVSVPDRDNLGSTRSHLGSKSLLFTPPERVVSHSDHNGPDDRLYIRMYLSINLDRLEMRVQGPSTVTGGNPALGRAIVRPHLPPLRIPVPPGGGPRPIIKDVHSEHHTTGLDPVGDVTTTREIGRGL